jgi:competence protein ComEA
VDGWTGRYRATIFIILVAVILLGVAAFLWRRPPSAYDGPIIQIASVAPSAAPTPTSTPSPLRVYVSGAVAHPDVYRLPPSSIVKDAVAAAGGALSGADVVRVNLAQELCDQQQIHVPLQGETPPSIDIPMEIRSPSRAVGCMDINTATQQELDGLPGIGPAYAQRIIAYRVEHGPFQNVEDLVQIRGIGPAVMDEIRDMICVR